MIGHWPRRTGYALMVVALLIAIAWREGHVLADQRSLALLLVLLIAGIGLILVITDRMVRAIYAQIEQAKQAQASARQSDCSDHRPTCDYNSEAETGMPSDGDGDGGD